jgi:hypothetical protein
MMMRLCCLGPLNPRIVFARLHLGLWITGQRSTPLRYFHRTNSKLPAPLQMYLATRSRYRSRDRALRTYLSEQVALIPRAHHRRNVEGELEEVKTMDMKDTGMK